MANTPPIPNVASVKSASLVDALGRRFDHVAHINDMVSPTPGRVLFGPAVTLAFMPVRRDLYDQNVHNFARLYYEAVGDAPAGKVLVMASQGYADTSMGGGTKLSRLHNDKLAGLLCDGRIRDFDELERYDFACYCTGTTPRWGGDRLMPFAANVPVAVAGVTVVPGDYVYADQASVVVVPGGVVEEVVAEAEAIERDDEKFIEAIRAEDREKVLRQGSDEI